MDDFTMPVFNIHLHRILFIRTFAASLENIRNWTNMGEKNYTLPEDESFITDNCDRIVLTQEMRDAAHKAEQDYEDGKCLSEELFKQRFAKWF